MQVRSFGKIAIPTPGTPVRLTTDTTLRVARLRFAAVIAIENRHLLTPADYYVDANTASEGALSSPTGPVNQ